MDTFLKAYGLEKDADDMKEQRKKVKSGSTYHKRSVQKLVEKIGCPNVESSLKEQTTTIPALVGRLELYVEENRWKKTDLMTKQALFTIICQIEKQLKKGLLKKWNVARNEILQSKASGSVTAHQLIIGGDDEKNQQLELEEDQENSEVSASQEAAVKKVTGKKVSSEIVDEGYP